MSRFKELLSNNRLLTIYGEFEEDNKRKIKYGRIKWRKASGIIGFQLSQKVDFIQQ